MHTHSTAHSQYTHIIYSTCTLTVHSYYSICTLTVHTVLWMPRCGDFPLFFPLFYCCQTPLDFVHENVMGTLKCPHNYGVVIV